jgi:hypothetical protein
LRVRARLAAGTAVSMLVIAPAAALPGGAGAAKAPTVKAPKSGKYTGAAGPRRRLILYVSRKSLTIVAFQFSCGEVVGQTSLNDIKLTRTRRGYKFAIRAHGSVTFSDGQPDENAAVHVSGRFRLSGRTVLGLLRVKSPRCADTGKVRWRAHRP